MMPELRKATEETVRAAFVTSKHIMEKYGSHPPVLFLLGDDGVTEMVDLSDYIEDKDMMALMIRSYQAQEGINGSVLLTEAWVVQHDKNSPEGKYIAEHGYPEMTPSESPDRKEVLFYMIETKFGNFAAQAPIMREGNEVTVGELAFNPWDEGDGDYQGRFIGGISKN